MKFYIRPYPGPGGERLVSVNGGVEPLWSPNGKELFYREKRDAGEFYRLGNRMMVVSVETNPLLPKELFQESYRTSDHIPQYDINPNGDRFVMVKRVVRSSASHFNIVTNWFEELRTKFETAKD